MDLADTACPWRRRDRGAVLAGGGCTVGIANKGGWLQSAPSLRSGNGVQASFVHEHARPTTYQRAVHMAFTSPNHYNLLCRTGRSSVTLKHMQTLA